MALQVLSHQLPGGEADGCGVQAPEGTAGLRHWLGHGGRVGVAVTTAGLASSSSNSHVAPSRGVAVGVFSRQDDSLVKLDITYFKGHINKSDGPCNEKQRFNPF